MGRSQCLQAGEVLLDGPPRAPSREATAVNWVNHPGSGPLPAGEWGFEWGIFGARWACHFWSSQPTGCRTRLPGNASACATRLGGAASRLGAGAEWTELPG